MLAAIDCVDAFLSPAMEGTADVDEQSFLAGRPCDRRRAVPSRPAASSGSGRAGPASAAPKSPLVIGASVSLTGDFADPGKAVKTRLRAVGGQVNAKGGMLGRQVQLKIVDDTSSPNQVVTNYQNLINSRQGRPGLRAVLQPAHGARVAGRQALRLRVPRAGRRRAGGVRTEPGQPVLRPAGAGGEAGRRVRRLGALAAGRTAAEDRRVHRAGRPVRHAHRREHPARGSRRPASRPSTSRSTRPRRRTSRRSWPRSPRPSRTCWSPVPRARTPTAQVKSLVQLKFSPKFMFMSNGANSPAEFPDKVGAAQHGRHHVLRRLVPGLEGARQRRVHRGVHQEVRRHRRHDRQHQRRGVRRRPGARGGTPPRPARSTTRRSSPPCTRAPGRPSWAT